MTEWLAFTLEEVIHQNNAAVEKAKDVLSLCTVQDVDLKDLATFWRIVRQICMAMRHVHEQGYFHRDLKPNNIMLDGHADVRIVDFGLSRAKMSGVNMMTGMQGTPGYMAPELIESDRIDASTAIDVYAFGVILWEMHQQQRPYAGMSPYEVMKFVMDGGRPDDDRFFSSSQSRSSKPWSHALRCLVYSCWQRDPALRPGFSNILNTVNDLAGAVSSPVISPSSPALLLLPSQWWNLPSSKRNKSPPLGWQLQLQSNHRICVGRYLK